MKAPIDNTNLGGTEISAIFYDESDEIDRELLKEKMRQLGCKTKKEYVQYMISLHRNGNLKK